MLKLIISIKSSHYRTHLTADTGVTGFLAGKQDSAILPVFPGKVGRLFKTRTEEKMAKALSYFSMVVTLGC